MADLIMALTIQQPWAWAIAHATKHIENRTWATRRRGLLAIHAGARVDRGALDDMRIRAAIRDLGIHQPDYTLGAVIAVAHLASIHSCEGRCSAWAMYGHHHWELADVRTLTDPVPCKGRLGLWPLPTDVDAAVRGQLAAQGAHA